MWLSAYVWATALRCVAKATARQGGQQVQPSNAEYRSIFQEDGSPRRLRVDDPSAIAKVVLTLLGLLFGSNVYSPFLSYWG